MAIRTENQHDATDENKAPHPAESRKKLRALCVVGLFVVGLISALFWLNRRPDINVEATLFQAEAKFAEQEYVAAHRLAASILEQDPDNLRAILMQARCLNAGGKPAEAVELLEKLPATAEPPHSVEAATLAGDILLMRLQRPAAARKFYLRALRDDSSWRPAHDRLAMLLGVSGQWWEQIPHRLAAMREGQITRFHLYVLTLAENAIDKETAKQFQAASPNDPLVMLAVARIAYEEERLSDAEPILRRVIETTPDLVRAHLLLGTIHFDQQDDRAFVEWNSGLPAEASEHPGIWALRGRWALRQSQPQQALRCFCEAIALDPNHTDALHQAGRLLVSRKNDRQAALFLERAKRLQEYLSAVKAADRKGAVAEIQKACALAEELGNLWEAYGWATLVASQDNSPAWANETASRLKPKLPELKLARTQTGHNPIRGFDYSGLPLPVFSKALPPKVAKGNDADPAVPISFVDRAEAAGVRFQYFNGSKTAARGTSRMYEVMGGGVAVVDFNGDQLPDLYLTQGCDWPVDERKQRHLDRLFLNDGNGRFIDVTESCGIRENRFSQGAAIGDFDSDGFPDILVANIGRNRLYHNNGDGTFTDVSDNAGFDRSDWTTSCAIADLSGDGHPEIYVVNYLKGSDLFTRDCSADRGEACLPQHFSAADDRLYWNTGSGSFQDVTDSSGIGVPNGKGLGIVIGAFGRSPGLNVFVANDTVANFYLENQGAGEQGTPRFRETSLIRGLALNHAGRAQACMGVAAGDADGDGLIDLYITNFHGESNTLYRQLSEGTFQDDTISHRLRRPSLSKLGFGTQFLDADLNGKLDLIVSNGHIDNYSRDGRTEYQMQPQFFENRGAGGFREVKADALGPYFGRKLVGRSLARLDWNRDGKEDAVVMHLDAPVALLENTTRTTGRFLTLQLRGVQSNRDAIGTIVRVQTPSQTITRQLTAGDGFHASNERLLVFGLGSSQKVARITVTWPSGRSESFENALELANRVLDREPENTTALTIAGDASFALEQFDQALEFYRKVPEGSSQDAVHAQLRRGRISLHHLGDAVAAEAHFRSALKHVPDNENALFQLASLLGIQARRREAIPAILRLFRQGSFNSDFLPLLQSENAALFNSKELDRYRKAAPDHAAVLNGLAWQARKEHADDKARKLLQRAVKSDPDFAEARVALAGVLWDLGNTDELNALLGEPKSQEIDDPRFWTIRGRLAERERQGDAATRCFWEAFRRDQTNRDATYKVFRYLVESGRNREAEAFRKRVEALQSIRELTDLVVSKQHANTTPIRQLVEQLQAIDRLWEAWAWCRMALQIDRDAKWAIERREALFPQLKKAPLTLACRLDESLKVDLSKLPLPKWKVTASGSPKSSAGDQPLITFRDDAKSAGLAFQYFNSPSRAGAGQRMYEFNGGGVAVLDFDNDGWPDLYLTQGCRWPVDETRRDHLDRLFRNLGNGRFEDVTAAAGLEENRFSTGVSVADFDNDGFDDLYIANIGANRLFRNNGDGTFADVTTTAGVGDKSWSTSCVVADFNGDALPDIYSANYLEGPSIFETVCKHQDGHPRMCMPFHFPAAQDQLYLNLGDGRFDNVTEKSGVRVPNGKGLGVVAGDWEGNGRLGLFVANDTVENFFFVNQGARADGTPQFQERGLAAGVAFNRNGKAEGCMGIAVGDADDDGRLDLFITNFLRETNTLYRSSAPGRFDDATREAGLARPSLTMLGFGTQFLDADLDGRLDLIVTNGHIDDYRRYGRPYKMPAQFFWNAGGGRFVLQSADRLGPHFSRELLGRGLARTDWNRDGREDAVISHLDQPAVLLTNTTKRTGNWLSIRLRGTRTSRDAIGATVVAHIGQRTIVRQLTAGDGYQASNQRELIFGLGSSKRVDRLTVRWPGGATVEFRDTAPNQRLLAIEGRDRLIRLPGDDRPSAREISNAIAAVDEAETNERYLTDLLWMWGQFIDHDIDLTDNATDEFGNPLESLPIDVPAGDLWFDPAGDGDATIAFNRSVYTEDEDGVRQQVNQITAFLDGSVVYGSDAERAAELRTFSGGLLKTSDGDLLPFNEAGLENAGGTSDALFLAGDVRANENAALSAMHTIWVREHNRIAAELAAEQPNLTDEELYQQARARVTAEIQVITFHEFLPALLGAGAVSEYTGYDESVNPAISNVFSTAAYRLGHSLLSSELLRIDESGEVIAAGTLPLQSAFFSPDALIDHGVDSLLRGASANVAQELDNQVVDDIRNFLFGQPGPGGFDLASLNIQRGRDHGLPDYNQARIDLGLEPIESFSELTSDLELAAALESVYGDVNQIDVWVGGLAEDHLPGSSVGVLFTTVIVDQFERLRDGDRFWYENLYSGQALAELEATTLADVIERNTGITGLQDNVFFAPEVFVVDLDEYDVADVKVTTQGGELRIVDAERGRVVASRSLEDVSRLVITSTRVTPHTIELAGFDESQLPNGIVIDTGRGTRDTLILHGSRSSDTARVDADEVEFNGVVIEHVGIERVNLAGVGRNDSFEVTPEAEETLDLWREGKRPEIEEFVSGWAEPGRSALLRELLAVELEFLRILDATITRDDYCARFPDDVDLVADVFGESPTMTMPGDDQASTIVVAKPDSRSEASPAGTGVGGTVGDYEIQEEIARGGMGVVYKARQTRLNRIVALKMIKAGELAGDEEIKRFHAEAEAAAKLDHPGIVPIYEVGEWRTGGSGPPMHFFSMGFVEGRSLADRLKEGPLAPKDGAAMLKTIAEAVQYAHDKGIVHRDLKPANVLLADDRTDTSRAIETEPGRAARDISDSRTTPTEIPADAPRLGAGQLGSPRITDFGLAKNIATDSGMTATGQILGTPSYMPPEQASGRLEEVGPRSDVYSLGAMLYAVLTGRPPFQAANAIETLKQVTEREPVSPAQLNPAVDRDLETICLKCLEKDVVKRYASARDFAADLSRYLEGKPILARPVGPVEKTWRWCRRNPMTTAVVLLVLLLATGGPLMALVQSELRARANREAGLAKQATQEAEQNLATARVRSRALQMTISQWVQTTKNSRLLKEPRFKDELREMLKQARMHYEQFIDEYMDVDDAEVRKQVVQAMIDIGYINSESGSKTEAIASYRRLEKFLLNGTRSESSLGQDDRDALAVCYNNLGSLFLATGDTKNSLKAYDDAFRVVSALAREDARFDESLALAYFNLGVLHRVRGDGDTALSKYRKALEIRKRLLKREPESVEVRRNVGISLRNIAELHAAFGRTDEALQSYLKVLSIQKKLTEEVPSDADLLDDIAYTHNNLGILLDGIGKQSEAMKSYLTALELRKRLARENPTITMYRRDLAGVHHNIGRLQEKRREDSKALMTHKAAMALRKELTASNPRVTQFQEDLASSYDVIATLHQRQNELELALDYYRRGQQIHQNLVKQHPAIIEYRLGLAYSFDGLSSVLRRLSQPVQAKSAFDESLRIRQELVAQHPDHFQSNSNLADSYYALGRRFRRNGDYDEAIKNHQEALKIRKKLYRRSSALTNLRDDLGSSYSALGKIFLHLKRLKEAVAALREAIAVRKLLVEKSPSVVSYQKDLARTLSNIGIAYQRAGQLSSALKAMQESIQLQQRLVRDHPDVQEYKADLATRHFNIGALYRTPQTLDKARDAYETSAGILKQLLKLDPGKIKYQVSLARSLNNLGHTFLQMGRLSDALSSHQAACDLRIALVRQSPENAGYRLDLTGSRNNLGVICLELGRPKDALPHLDAAISGFEEAAKQSSDSSKYDFSLRNAYYLRARSHDALGNYVEAADSWRNTIRFADRQLRLGLSIRMALSLARAGKHAESVRLAGTISNSAQSGSELSLLSKVYGIASAIVAGDHSLTIEEKRKLHSEYASAAVSVLKRAADNNYFRKASRVRRLATSGEYNSLRHRDDFRKFAKSVGIELPAWARRPQSSDAATP
eukprot:g12592.t1